MGDLSVAVLVGRLTRDAELKYTNSGQAICSFSVATNSRVKKGDQWVDESSYWDIDLWGKRAESVSQYLTKGKLVAVQGDMRQDKWEKDGQQRMKVRVTANDVQLIGGDGRGQGGGSDNRPSFGGPDRGNQGRPPGPAQGRQGGWQGGGRDAGRGNERGGQDQGPGRDDFTDDIPF